MRPTNPVVVYDYLAYRSFLADWFAAEKQANPRYSHRLFARRAGVSSPSLLREVTVGQRNLTPQTLPGFARALRLGDDEAAFFADLVQLEQGATQAERDEALDRVAASRRFRSARPIEGASVRFLLRWYYGAVRELALRPDFVPDPAWIAGTLQPRITEAQAADALQTLRELALLVERDGRTVPADESLATPHEVAAQAANHWHRQMLERASEAITEVPPAERHLLGTTVAIPEALVPRLKSELNAFQERVHHLCDEHSAQAERVYQVGLFLVPLSRGVAR